VRFDARGSVDAFGGHVSQIMEQITSVSSSGRSRLERHFNSCAALSGAVVSGVGLMGLPSEAQAAVVFSGPLSIAIPVTTAGVYLNVVTGVNGITQAAAPGWDLNPWSGSALSWFNPAQPPGGVYGVALGTSATLPDNLPLGTLIDASTIFGSGASETTGATAFVLNSANNYVGFRFQNESAGNAINYGWVQVSLGATLNNASRRIVAYAYENSGAGIQIGQGQAVPEAGTAVAGALGLLAAGALGLRRRRAI